MIGIIGAGISGLATAYFLQKRGKKVMVFESSDRPGGNIWSGKKGDYLLEYGPNSILCGDTTLQFFNELGLGNQIVKAADVSKKRFIFRGGRYQALPASPPSLLFNTFFSAKTKWAIFKEMRLRNQGPADETVAAFFKRRFTPELVAYAVNPFVAGIYAGDPEQLLIQLTFPMVADYEKQYGSILKGFIKNKKATERKTSYSFQQGMEMLPKALAEKTNVQYQTAVSRIETTETGFVVHTNQGEFALEQVIMALPAHAAGRLLAPIQPELGEKLQQFNYPPMVVVHTAWQKTQSSFDFNGFGGLHPSAAGLFTAGSIWSSSVFPGRAPEGQVLLTSFVGGSQFLANAQLDDDRIKQKVVDELKQVYHLQGEPMMVHTTRWEKSIPQYDMKAKLAMQALRAADQPGIHFCSNWAGGISVADCLKKAEQLARDID